MALVIFFVPDPAKGVAEMVRVVSPSGMVAAYVWDFLGGGSPQEAMREEMRAMDVTTPSPPSVEASRRRRRKPWWICGVVQASKRSRSASSTFKGHLRISTTTGRQVYWDPALGRQLPACQPVTLIPMLNERFNVAFYYSRHAGFRLNFHQAHDYNSKAFGQRCRKLLLYVDWKMFNRNLMPQRTDRKKIVR